MKYSQIAVLATITLFIASCKLDPPILPGQPGYVDTAPTTTGSGSTSGTGSSTGTGSGTGTGSTTGTGGSTGTGSGTGTGSSTGTGTGSGTSISLAALTGTWKVSSTNLIGYMNGTQYSNQSSPTGLFDSVIIDDGAKTLVENDLTDNPAISTTYTLSTSGGKTYMLAQIDPLPRSGNGNIEIVSVSSTSMTWFGMDPSTSTISGMTFTFGYQIVFTKQ